MKRNLLISFFLVTTAILFAGASVYNFQAKSSSGNVVISWQTTSETNVRNFVVERKTVNGTYTEVITLDPRADRNYEYVDRTAFKSADQLYIYRLKIVDTDGSASYSDEKAVAHNVSSVKRTWGSIKALFR